MSDTPKNLMRSALHFFSGTLISRASGLARDVIMAFAFGTQEAVAAFLVAFRFAHLLRRLLGEGALQTAFIPHFEALRQESEAKASSFFLDLYASLSCLLGALILIISTALFLLLWMGNLSAGNAQIVLFSALMLPSLLFICLFGLNASLLQCKRIYFTPSVAPIAFNCIWIFGALCLYSLPIVEAMTWLSGFIIAACFIQWLVTLPQVVNILRSSLHSEGKSSWLKNIKLYSKEVLDLKGPLFLGIIGVAASQVNSLADAVFARYADSQGPAYLWFAIRIQQLPLALFGIAISGALLPPLSRAIKAADLSTYYRLLQFSLKQSVLFMVPITAAILLFGGSCINLIYGHGDFNNESTIQTTFCLWGYSLGLLPTTLVLILAPALYAQGNYKTPARASVFSMALNCALNIWFVVGLHWGAPAIALATSISAWANLTFLIFAMKNDIKNLVSLPLGQYFAHILLATLLSGIGVYWVEKLVFGNNQAIAIFWGVKEHPFPREIASQAMHFFILSSSFSIFFAAFAWPRIKPDSRLCELENRRSQLS